MAAAETPREATLISMASAPLKNGGRRARKGDYPRNTAVRPASYVKRRLCWVTCLETPGCDWPAFW